MENYSLIQLSTITVSYFSAGVSSAVATKMLINEIDRIMYTHIDDHHPDTMRFLHDCENWFHKKLRSNSPGLSLLMSAAGQLVLLEVAKVVQLAQRD